MTVPIEQNVRRTLGEAARPVGSTSCSGLLLSQAPPDRGTSVCFPPRTPRASACAGAGGGLVCASVDSASARVDDGLYKPARHSPDLLKAAAHLLLVCQIRANSLGSYRPWLIMGRSCEVAPCRLILMGNGIPAQETTLPSPVYLTTNTNGAKHLLCSLPGRGAAALGVCEGQILLSQTLFYFIRRKNPQILTQETQCKYCVTNPRYPENTFLTSGLRKE